MFFILTLCSLGAFIGSLIVRKLNKISEVFAFMFLVCLILFSFEILRSGLEESKDDKSSQESIIDWIE